jgi:hypothetical protein
MSGPEFGAALIGLVIGGIFFGMVIMQAGHYFRSYRSDPIWLRLSVALLCLLDTLHLCFSVHMMYFYLVTNFGNISAVNEIVWSLKGLAAVQVFVIWLVQCLYLLRIWKLSKGIVTDATFSTALLASLIITLLFALGIGVMFMIELTGLKRGVSITSFRWAIFLAFTATIAIDTYIAAILSYLLWKSQTGIKRTDSTLFTLIQYIVGTGVLTSLASFVYMLLYVLRPNSLLYLALEFSMTRLYSNSFLAMMNARSGLRGQLSEPVDLEINLGSAIRFGPSSSMSLGSHVQNKGTPPTSPVV